MLEMCLLSFVHTPCMPGKILVDVGEVFVGMGYLIIEFYSVLSPIWQENWHITPIFKHIC